MKGMLLALVATFGFGSSPVKAADQRLVTLESRALNAASDLLGAENAKLIVILPSDPSLGVAFVFSPNNGRSFIVDAISACEIVGDELGSDFLAVPSLIETTVDRVSEVVRKHVVGVLRAAEGGCEKARRSCRDSEDAGRVCTTYVKKPMFDNASIVIEGNAPKEVGHADPAIFESDSDATLADRIAASLDDGKAICGLGAVEPTTIAGIGLHGATIRGERWIYISKGSTGLACTTLADPSDAMRQLGQGPHQQFVIKDRSTPLSEQWVIELYLSAGFAKHEWAESVRIHPALLLRHQGSAQ